MNNKFCPNDGASLEQKGEGYVCPVCLMELIQQKEQ